MLGGYLTSYIWLQSIYQLQYVYFLQHLIGQN